MRITGKSSAVTSVTAASELGPGPQTLAVPGDEEDEVVGEDAEEEADDHRLDLAGEGEAEVPPTQPRPRSAPR